MRHVARQQLPKLFLCSCITLLGVGLRLLDPWPLKVLVDSVFGNTPAPFVPSLTGSEQLLGLVAAAYVGLYIVSGALEILDGYLTAYYTNRLSVQLQQQFFYHILNLPLTEKQRIDSGEYVYRLNEQADNLPVLLFSTLVSVVSSVCTIVAAILVLAWLNLQMAIIGACVVPLLYLSIKRFTHKIEDTSDEIAVATGDIYNLSTESIENVSLIKAYNRQAYQTHKYGNLLWGRARRSQRLTLLNGLFEYSNNVFTATGTAVVLAVGGYQVFRGNLTVGELLIFVTYMRYLYDPLENLLSAYSGYKSLLSGIKQVHEVNEKPDEHIQAQPAQQLSGPVRGHLSFRAISLRRGSKQIFDGVSLDIQPGQKVALVGPSGSGKSSLVQMLPRFIEPDQGQILLDGIDIASLDLRQLREQFSIVTQEASLLTGTVKENIGFAIPEEKLDLPDIMIAAEAANALPFINKLPGGLDAVVGESGNNLSGGQRQRISIARAFVKRAPVLLLDEPTSALDRASGARILSAIRKLMEGKTVVMVTHDLSLLELVDAIYLIDEGKIKRMQNVAELEAYFHSLKENPERSVGIKLF